MTPTTFDLCVPIDPDGRGKKIPFLLYVTENSQGRDTVGDGTKEFLEKNHKLVMIQVPVFWKQKDIYL